jgi:hypothetical protein
MRTLTLLAALAIACPSVASAYDFRFRVTQINKTDFTVQNQTRAGVTDYWCGAGRYVLNTLGLPSRTRVYLLSPLPRKAGQGLSFTLDASRSFGKTGVTTFGGPQDGSMSAGGAEAGFCYTFDYDDF